QVRHRRTGLRSRHVNRANFLARRLVVRAEHRAALTVRRREEAALACDHQCLCGEDADSTLTASTWNIQPLQRRIVLDVVGRLAVGDLPYHLALVEIERGDA